MGKVKTIVLGVFLLAVIAFPFVLGLTFMHASNLHLFSNLGSSPMGGTGTANLFVSPKWLVQDYTSMPVGSKFSVYVNVTGITDLYTWQVNLTYNAAVLHVNSVSGKAFNLTEGDFLLRTTSPSKTADYQLNSVINQTDNTKGFTGISDSVLGTYSGITGSGRLVWVQFLVVGYGTSSLNLSLTGNLKTTFLNSTGGAITFTKTDAYFDNRIPGDITGPSGAGVYDGLVNSYDLVYLGKAYGTSDKIADFTGAAGVPDGTVSSYDLVLLGKNYGRHYP